MSAPSGTQGAQGPQGAQGSQGVQGAAIDDRVMGFAVDITLPAASTQLHFSPDGGGTSEKLITDLSPFDRDANARRVAIALGETYTLVNMHVAMIENINRRVLIELHASDDAADTTFTEVASIAFDPSANAAETNATQVPITLQANSRIAVLTRISTGLVGAVVRLNGSLVLRRTTPSV